MTAQLMCVAVCCSVLQCDAVCCSVCMHESCHTPPCTSYTTTVVLILQNSVRHCRRSFCSNFSKVSSLLNVLYKMTIALTFWEILSGIVEGRIDEWQQVGILKSQLYSHLIWSCSVLQCVAVCCSVLQCVAVCCSVLQCVAVCCSVLQCAAVCCSQLSIRLIW